MEKDCSASSAKRPAAEVVGSGRAATTASSCSSGPDAKKPRASAAGAAAAAPPPTRWAAPTEQFDREEDGETMKLGLRDLFGRSASSSSSAQQEGQGQRKGQGHGGGHSGGRTATARRFPRLPQGGGVGGQLQPPPPSHRPQHPPPPPESDEFFTFRLERRRGGTMARHAGEERVLLFRSDRKGAVAKVVYSSHGAPAAPVGAEPVSGGGSGSGSADTAAEAKSAEEYGESELRQMAQAKIHVLDVKEPYRGRDLGGLLFSEAVQSLRDQYGRADEEQEEEDEASAGEGQNKKAAVVPPLSSSVRCQLDAEEDVRRHNKLVGFYEGLGCRIKPRAKIRYIPNPNNENETYRKVPMQMALLPSPARDRKPPAVCGADGRSPSAPHQRPHRRHLTKAARSLVGRRGGFLLVRLLDSSGRTIGVPAARRRRTDWLLVDDGENGGVRFRTTQGHRIAATHDGRVMALSPDDDDEDYGDCDVERSSSDDAAAASCSCLGCLLPDERDRFRLCRVPDGAGASFLGGGGPSVVSDSDTSDDESAVSPHIVGEDGGDGDGARRREELWTLRSSHGTYLSADPVTHSLTCTESPSFWRADRYDLSLTCTTSATATATAADAPPPPSTRRRTHLRRTWKTQSVEYVRTMRDRYLSFRRGRCDVRSALERARSLPCRPFRARGAIGAGGCVETGGSPPSLRTFSFRLAEHARRAGLPDWIQMAALVHELGRVVPLLDPPAAAATAAATEAGAAAESDGGYDWTLPCRSRVVGCAPPERSASSSFRDFRDLNPDRDDDRYDSALGMYEEHCGLDDVLLTWSGPEYVYHMLRHNGASMPEEGLAMIRLFSLRDWHERGEYRQIANDDDEDRRLFVSEFYRMRREVLRECGDDGKDLSDAECDRLWKCYFSNVLEKYSCGGELSW